MCEYLTIWGWDSTIKFLFSRKQHFVDFKTVFIVNSMCQGCQRYFQSSTCLLVIVTGRCFEKATKPCNNCITWEDADVLPDRYRACATVNRRWEGSEMAHSWATSINSHVKNKITNNSCNSECNAWMQHFIEIGMLCDLAPPTIFECNTTVVNTNPRSVTICQT